MNIVGITSCTCGIAHTYMAREKLLETGEKFGWSVKIETQGSGGVEFALTDEDINAAPMRSPVKEPGPFATATASISSISKDVLLITSSNIGSNV